VYELDYITVSVSIPSLAAPSPIAKAETKPALNSFIAHCKPTEQGVRQQNTKQKKRK
jgi:hypothetical protein